MPLKLCDAIRTRKIDDSYGLAWNESTDVFTRLGTLSAYSTSYSNKPFSNVPDHLLPIQRGMKRCVVEDDGTVAYYLHPNDSTKKADGSAAVLDGTDGQVMVEIPEHWWKYEKSGDVHYWYVSPTEKSGWNHFEKSYIGAYEAAIWDHSASDYVGGSSNIVDTANDKLASVAAGVTAHTNETRAEYRTIAENRGTGWHQLDNRIWAAVQRLMIIEYANFNFQDKISTGLTDANSTDWSNYNGYSPLHNAGLTNGLGNVTGEVALDIENFVGGTGTLETQVCSYRGIENPFGHIWKFLDGVNVHNSTANGSRLYICDTPANYADDSDTNYDLKGSLAEAGGYGLTLVPTEAGFFPASVGASSTTGLCDYYYTYFDDDPDSGWRVVLVSGPAPYGAHAGVFCVSSYSASSYDAAHIGARLCAKF